MKKRVVLGVAFLLASLCTRFPLTKNPLVWRANGDAKEYLRLARTDSLMNDKRPPGYPFFLKMIGQDSLVSPKVQVVLSSVAAGALALADPWASVSYSFTPGSVGYSPVLIPDVIFALLLFLGFWLLLKLPSNKSWVSGLLFFLAFTLKPVGFYMGLLAPVVKPKSWKWLYSVFLPLALALALVHHFTRGGSILRANYGVWKTVLWRASAIERRPINEKMGVVQSIKEHPVGVAGAIALGSVLVSFSSNAPILAWETGRFSGELYGAFKRVTKEGIGGLRRVLGPWLIVFVLEPFLWGFVYIWGLRRALKEKGWRLKILLPLGFYLAASSIAGAPRLRVGIEPILFWWAFGG